jgi:poly(A) polymerase Pap1
MTVVTKSWDASSGSIAQRGESKPRGFSVSSPSTTSAATETERRLATEEITKLSSSNVINEKDINAARGKLRKIEEKFEKRTALSKESHDQFVVNRRAEADIANKIQNITYGIDTRKNVRVKVEGKVAVPELEA